MMALRTLAGLVFFVGALAVDAAAGDLTGCVFFGDSLSDAGNHFIAFGTTSHQPFSPIPEASYPIGGHHFSNGATWAEQLATAAAWPANGNPALRNPGLFTNYAVGRARARAGAPVFPSYDLGTQVGHFLSDFDGHASPNNVYVIWIGSNDLDDALTALFIDPSGMTSSGILQAALTAIASNIQTLWVSGARTFLILNVPNLAVTPAVRAIGSDAEFAAAALTAAFNDSLDQVMSVLQGLPEIHVLRLDVNALFDEVLTAPETSGLSNVHDACLSFGVVGDAICPTPNRYLFWDGIHPTTAAHGLIASAAWSLLTLP